MCSQAAGTTGLDMLLCLWEGGREWEALGMGEKGGGD